MENTLRVGDFLLANKFVYGAHTPRWIPFTNVRIPSVRFPSVTQPQRGDVVVFELPDYASELNAGARQFVKRCIAQPGDTILIRNKRVFVNGEEFPLSEFARPSKRKPFPEGYGDERIFPKGMHFNEDNFGPLAIPKRGDKIQLNASSFFMFKDIIEHEGNQVRLDSGAVFVNGVRSGAYTMQQDYFFMMGDNRDNSSDSRFWGFVPDDLIIGKVMMIYFSVDELNGSFPTNIRWGRVGTIVH
jgi:signal peptidase I